MRHKIFSIGDIIENEKDFINFRKKVREFDIVVEFSEIFPDLKQIAQAVKVSKNVLFLHVENSVWRSELKLRQQIIINRINKALKEEIIKTIKFI